MIKSTNTDQHQIIRDIITLHIPDGIELDPTYSKGVFYKGEGIAEPKYKFDLYPQDEATQQASADALPLEDNSIGSIMFDPPFLAGYTKEKPTGKMGERFHGFRYVPELWSWYSQCLCEFRRVLKPGGFLVFKCQDTVSSGKNWFSHVMIMQQAALLDFYAKDLFILIAKNRMIGHNHAKQQHARKFHSYFWVFQKKDKTNEQVD